MNHQTTIKEVIHRIMPHPDEYVTYEAWEKDRDAALQDITRIVEGVAPEKQEPKPEDYDMFGDYDHTIRMRNYIIDTYKSNLRKVLQ